MPQWAFQGAETEEAVGIVMTGCAELEEGWLDRTQRAKLLDKIKKELLGMPHSPGGRVYRKMDELAQRRIMADS